MMIAKLAVPLIISRLGEMVSSFLFLAFVGQFIPDALGHASFAWAFVSLLTVVGIGFFSILMIEVAGAHGSNDSRVFELLNAALKLSVFMGFFVTASVFLYAVITANEFQGFYADSEKVLVLMSVSMPAIYLQIVVFNYFNALGQPKFELIFVWFFNTLICFVSALLLIFVSELDVISFVAGYVGARWVLVMVVLGFLYIKTRKNSFGFILFQAVPALEYKVFFFKGLPLALCFGGESFLYFFFSVVSKNIGDLELSAYQASLHFLSVIYMISIGIGNATAILTAKPYEQGKLSEFKGRCMEGMVFGVLLLIPCLFACLLVCLYVFFRCGCKYVQF
ncbi:multidrug efflux protein [compost metagenome]